MPDPRTYLDTALPLVTKLEECADYSKTVLPFMPQLNELYYKIVENITNWHELQHIYASTNPLITSLAFAIFMTPVVLTVSEVNRNYSQVDRLWSIIPAIYNIHYSLWAHINGIPASRVDHVMAVSVIWGLRLTYNYWRKGGYSIGSEDYRWNIVKDYIGTPMMFILNVTFISLGQMLLLWIITTPTYILLLSSRLTGNETSKYDSFFGRTMIFIVVVEWFADQQQWNYHKAKSAYQKTAKVPAEYKYTRAQLDRGFNTSGLWAYSRHPNFAAEQTFWVCLYQWCCMESQTYLNWAGIGAFAYLMLFQASTWLTELITSGKYPDYKLYQQRVSKFLPKANTKNMEDTPTQKEKAKLEKMKQPGKIEKALKTNKVNSNKANKKR